MATAGYSGTPLAKKLGIKPGFSLYVHNEPLPYASLFDDLPEDITFPKQPIPESLDFAHAFCTTFNELEEAANTIIPLLKKTGMLWMSWPKGSSKIPSEINRESVRDHLLAAGLVDTKVCAVNEDWSGLKFVYRLKDR
ncbi:DUF3052 domain-containing protein [Aureisphaera galaxeae]|uniref:DUF3052 domain-containing protein n=1 Tax=Aureisphaera galaxeae TaxID=1538023 RepID=UPI002350385A|nr:DUF3052 domain-containing protein [Aureisphaera galaxeae]MDC8002826.1 DUF3052 domain-containing protein [Aureisphaera galaxeae]